MTKILIVGDSGRGKSTLAQKLSEKLKIEKHSTDDYFWKVKFSIPNNKELARIKFCQIYQNQNWIIEGTTRSFIEDGVKQADLIIYLGFKNLLHQYWTLFKRYTTREEETLSNLLNLYIHLFKKRFKLGPHRNKPSVWEMVKSHQHKVIKLYSFKDIDKFIHQYNQQ